MPDPVPAHIPENVAVGGDIAEDYDQVEQVAPETDTHPHTTHVSSENVEGT